MSVDYDNINSVLSIFEEQAHQFKEKPYLWRKINDKYASLSWSEVHDQVCKLALALSGLGILNGFQLTFFLQTAIGFSYH